MPYAKQKALPRVNTNVFSNISPEKYFFHKEEIFLVACVLSPIPLCISFGLRIYTNGAKFMILS